MNTACMRRALFVGAFGLSMPLMAMAFERIVCTDECFFCIGGCVDDTFTIRVGDSGCSSVSARVGEELEVTVTMEVAREGVRGWSLAVVYDEEKLQLLDVVTAEVTAEGIPVPQAGRDFTLPVRGGGAFTSQAIFLEDFPVGEVLALVRARYRVLPDLGIASLKFFFGGILVRHQGPPVGTCIFNAGECLTPERVFDAEIVVIPPAVVPPFIRSDSNGDGERDISDAVHVLTYLFLGGTSPECEKSSDSNDDGILDMADAVTHLRHLFFGDSIPAPEDCGEDSTVDELTCLSYVGCKR